MTDASAELTPGQRKALFAARQQTDEELRELDAKRDEIGEKAHAERRTHLLGRLDDIKQLLDADDHYQQSRGRG